MTEFSAVPAYNPLLLLLRTVDICLDSGDHFNERMPDRD
jgi:hypothetical protein